MKKSKNILAVFSAIIFVLALAGCQNPFLQLGKEAISSASSPFNQSTSPITAYEDGSEDHPFLVYDVVTLKRVGSDDVVNGHQWALDKHYLQIKDVDLTGAGNWAPIGSVFSDRFSGTYNGGGFAIFNLSCYGSSDYGTGLFSSLDEGAVVENVGLVNAYIKGDSYVGGIAGENFGIIQNCFFKGEGYSEGIMPVTNVEMLGGITGRNCGTVERCYSVGTLTGVNYVGGIVGENDNSFPLLTTPAIKDCYSSAVCTGIGGIATGGIAGNVCGYSLIQNCYALGNINGSTCAAGIVGEYFDEGKNGTMQNCVALNKKIIASNIDVARVAAGSISGDPVISKVYARYDMVLEGLVEALTAIDGTDVYPEQYNDPGWWENSSNWATGTKWDFDYVWEWGNNDLPILRGVGGQ